MQSLAGVVVLLAIGFALSSDRKAVNWRTIGIAFGVQCLVGFIALFSSWGGELLKAAASATGNLLGYSRAGIDFMFGQLANFDGPIGFVFAVFSAFIAVLYHLGIMMWIVRAIGGALRRMLGTSHAESMSAAANIFVGQA